MFAVCTHFISEDSIIITLPRAFTTFTRTSFTKVKLVHKHKHMISKKKSNTLADHKLWLFTQIAMKRVEIIQFSPITRDTAWLAATWQIGVIKAGKRTDCKNTITCCSLERESQKDYKCSYPPIKTAGSVARCRPTYLKSNISIEYRNVTKIQFTAILAKLPQWVRSSLRWGGNYLSLLHNFVQFLLHRITDQQYEL